MRRYKATDAYAHFGEVFLINGKGYALHWKIDNSAPCGRCALFNNITHDTEKMCGHPNKDKRMCKHEPGTSKGWNTCEYVHIPDRNIKPDEQLSLF